MNRRGPIPEWFLARQPHMGADGHGPESETRFGYEAAPQTRDEPRPVAEAYPLNPTQDHTTEAEAGTQARSTGIAFAIVLSVKPDSTAIE